jgi:rieske iron-sulfur protein
MTDQPASTPVKRRCILQAGCALVLAGAHRRGSAADDDASAPPAENDLLVHMFGPRAGQAITTEDLPVGAKQILAYPLNPATQRVRDGTRLNQLIVVRLDAAQLKAETVARAADGVVAYSGVCTHTGCDVTDWFDDRRHFKCPCHESEFDPADAARVVSGPAPWQLAALPLKIVDGKLTVAAPFVGKVGFAQPGLDSGLSPI